jgi:NAD(P)-dependent dehydrogenase (short-subunit alcohol dehydrogenase family)
MPARKQNRAVLITGAAKRIGRTIAVALARDGWAVGVHYNGSRREAESVVREIAALGGKAVALKADLAREAQVAKLVGQAKHALGPLACLVNNASVFERDEAGSVTRAGWDRHLEINLRAPFVLTQAFARQLPKGVKGNVINLIDERVWSLTPHFISYTVSKAGLWTLTQTLALALAPQIRVNGIGPGPTLPSPRQSAAQFRRQSASVPLGHGATPAEVAETVQYILATPSMTGQMIALDGGQHLGWAQPGQRLAPTE